MGTTRTQDALAEPVDQDHPDESKRTSFNPASIYASAVVMTYILGKLEYLYHTSSQNTSPGLENIVKVARQSGFKGFGVNICNNVSYSFILQSVKYNVETKLDQINSNVMINRQVAGFIGGACALLATYPLSVIEAWRYEGTKASAIINTPTKHFYRGLPSACLNDGTFYGTYFACQPMLSNYLSNQTSLSKNKLELISDSAAGIVAGFVSNPFYVISNCQKTSSKSIFDQTLTLFRQGGLPRFYRGFGVMGLINVGLFGLIAGASTRIAEATLDTPDNKSFYSKK